MRILITGGAGSIGSEVARRLATEGHAVRVMDCNEESIWSLKMQLPEAEIMLGDVQSIVDCAIAANGVDAVVHCAALKHVDLCERNPAFARRVNVHGTMNVLQAAEGRRVVFVSTDKAIDAISVMGRTKAEAEQYAIVDAANVVRFGNVIGSRGSLLPMVIRCARMGVPVPLTHDEMTRWFITVDDAVNLVFEALLSAETHKIFSPVNPKACNIKRFIEMCRYEFAPALEIAEGAMRPGERLHEPMQMRDGRLRWSNEAGVQMTWPELNDIVRAAYERSRKEAA